MGTRHYVNAGSYTQVTRESDWGNPAATPPPRTFLNSRLSLGKHVRAHITV